MNGNPNTFYSISSKEEYCLICKRICNEDQKDKIDVWNNHLISEDHLQKLYSQLQDHSPLIDHAQSNKFDNANKIKVFDYCLAQSIFDQGKSQCRIFSQLHTKIIQSREQRKAFRFYKMIFMSEKGWYEESDLLQFLQLEQFRQKSIQAINILQTSMGKQMSLKTKKQLKYQIQQRSKAEQASSQNFIICYEKLISIMIINDQERHALLFYLLFEFDLDIYDIPYLKFGPLSRGMFSLNYQRVDQTISKEIHIPEPIKLLFLSIMKKHNLQEQQQVVEIKSNRDLQTWLDKQKNIYCLVFQQQGDVQLSGFLKTLKLSDIKKYKKLVQLSPKSTQIQQTNNLKFNNLFLLFEQVIRNYLLIKQKMNQIPQQIQSLKKRLKISLSQRVKMLLFQQSKMIKCVKKTLMMSIYIINAL